MALLALCGLHSEFTMLRPSFSLCCAVIHFAAWRDGCLPEFASSPAHPNMDSLREFLVPVLLQRSVARWRRVKAATSKLCATALKMSSEDHPMFRDRDEHVYLHLPRIVPGLRANCLRLLAPAWALNWPGLPARIVLPCCREVAAHAGHQVSSSSRTCVVSKRPLVARTARAMLCSGRGGGGGLGGGGGGGREQCV